MTPETEIQNPEYRMIYNDFEYNTAKAEKIHKIQKEYGSQFGFETLFIQDGKWYLLGEGETTGWIILPYEYADALEWALLNALDEVVSYVEAVENAVSEVKKMVIGRKYHV